VPTVLAVQALSLRSGVDPDDLERLFETEILPAAADTPGSVNRANQSSIASQHLLRLAGGTEYLWIVKSSGVFAPDLFADVADRLGMDAAERLSALCDLTPIRVWRQVKSYDQGPRDLQGPTGEPRRDVDL
jgi:hypothetical protein